MKKFIKDWILPPKVLEFIQREISLYKLKKPDLSVIKINQKLKNKYKGKRCFILGNALTIKDIDITLLKDEYVFVMSTFYNHPDYSKLNNSIFSSVHLTGSKKYEENLKWMKAIDENTKSTNIFFFDLAQKQMIEDNNLFIGKNIYYIATANIKRSFDISTITKNYETNVIQTLEVAMYLGFKEIYLHSVNINSICAEGKYDYFFDRIKMPYKDPGVNNDGSCKDFYKQIESAYVASKGIFECKKYADTHNIKIYYTNKESLLKFFEYKDFTFFDKNYKNTKKGKV